MASFKLHNGMLMPAVGLGTFQGRQRRQGEQDMIDDIVFALQSGYRLIDTAQTYCTEAIVGKAILASGISRSEITVVTKLPPSMSHDPVQSFEKSLRDLQLDYIDIYLMHWPSASPPDGTILGINDPPIFIDTWRKMEDLIGPRCRAIGVSNFTQKTLDALLATTKTVPVVNQIELHVLNPNLKLVPYCHAKGIQVVSWSTLGGELDGGISQKEIIGNVLFLNIAKAHGCSSAAVSFSWAVQRGIAIIPKSNTRSRIMENRKLVTLSDDEMDALNRAHQTIRPIRITDHIPFGRSVREGKSTFMGWTNVDFGWEDEAGHWLT